MNIDQALGAVSIGHKVKLPEWSGYWYKDETHAICVFTKNGDIVKTPWLQEYEHRTDFEITDGEIGFDVAILALKNNKKVARKGWNGKNMFVVYATPRVHDNVGEYPTEPCLAMKTAQDTISMGWRPTSSDMLATDWEVIQ